MAKKKIVEKKFVAAAAKVLPENCVEENEVLAYLSKKSIAERDHLNISLDRVEPLLSSLLDKGLIEGSGSRVWLSVKGLELVKAAQ